MTRASHFVEDPSIDELNAEACNIDTEAMFNALDDIAEEEGIVVEEVLD